MNMRKFILFVFVAFFAVMSQSAIAAKPGTSPDAQPLRALWGAASSPSCEYFFIIEENKSIGLYPINTSQWMVTHGSLSGRLSPIYDTKAEAIDWLIQLFINLNGLDATLADVPVDSNGQRDCAAWNDQLVTS